MPDATKHYYLPIEDTNQDLLTVSHTNIKRLGLYSLLGNPSGIYASTGKNKQKELY